MDSVTQAVLGAAVGEAVAGRRIGNRALLLGAIAGTLPDLDIIASPFMDDISRFTAHRSLTHSFIAAPVAAGLLAWLCARIIPRAGLGREQWLQLFLWCFATHIVLDLCTAYGTQIFYPLSRYPYALSSVFIIDPFYTLPLLGAIAWLLLRKPRPALRRCINTTVLVLTTAYLATGFVLKVHADRVFADALAARGIHYRQLETFNTPFNILLRRAVAMTGDGHLHGWYSVLRPGDPPVFERVAAHPDRAQLDAFAAQSPQLAKLIYLARGSYRYEADGDGVDLVNLRIGAAGVYPFRFRVAHRDNGALRPVRPVQRVHRRNERSLVAVFRELRLRM